MRPGRSEDSASVAVDLAVAPHPSLAVAIDSILHLLGIHGLGTWRLAAAGEGRAIDGLALGAPGDPNGWRLEPVGDPPALTRERHRVVHEVARVIATILTADRDRVAVAAHAARAEREASTDHLTGVANARAWWRLLARQTDACDVQGHAALVAVVDLDGLKQANDQRGHREGDEMLRLAAKALVGALRSHDSVARIGGDEFAVLVVDPDPPPADELAGRLEASLTAVGIEASVGAARYSPGDRANDVHHEADLAMYRRKQARAEARRLRRA